MAKLSTIGGGKLGEPGRPGDPVRRIAPRLPRPPRPPEPPKPPRVIGQKRTGKDPENKDAERDSQEAD